MTGLPDDSYVAVEQDGSGDEHKEQQRREQQKYEDKAQIEEHRLDKATLPGLLETFGNFALFDLGRRGLPLFAVTFRQFRLFSMLPAPLVPEFLQGGQPYPFRLKPGHKFPVLPVDPVKLIGPRMDYPAHVYETAEKVHDMPAADFLYSLSHGSPVSLALNP